MRMLFFQVRNGIITVETAAACINMSVEDFTEEMERAKENET